MVRGRAAVVVAVSSIPSPSWTIQSATSPISDYYGTGLGQIPGHLAPESATLSSSNVTSVANLGGAGAALNAAKSGSGNIALTNGRFAIAAGTSPYLTLATAGDLVGTRLYMVAGIDQASVGNLNIAGHSVSTAAGGRTNIQWVRASNLLRLLRWNGASWESRDLDLGEVIGPNLRLIEIEIGDNDVIRVWMDGTLRATGTNPWADFIVSRIFAGYNSPYFSGTATDILWLRTDGAQDAAGERVRQELAQKNGLTLPGSATNHERTAAVASASGGSATGAVSRPRAAAVASASAATAAATISRARTAAVNAASEATAAGAISRARAATVAASSTVAASYIKTGATTASAAVVAASSVAAQGVRILARGAAVIASSDGQASAGALFLRAANVAAGSAVSAVPFVGVIISRHAYPGETRGGTIITEQRGGTLIHTARSGTILRG